MPISAVDDSAQIASPTQPGQDWSAPPQMNKPVAITWITRWCAASSMVSHDMKNVGRNRTRFFFAG